VNKLHLHSLRSNDGSGWGAANNLATHDNIIYGHNLTVEGSTTFPTSGHPGVIDCFFCDGSTRFIAAKINGTVWFKAISLPRAAACPSIARACRWIRETRPLTIGVRSGSPARACPG
jgi:hypothetical protein